MPAMGRLTALGAARMKVCFEAACRWLWQGRWDFQDGYAGEARVRNVGEWVVAEGRLQPRHVYDVRLRKGVESAER
jgi:hypothetical protein